jgi:hypothetical protein
VASNAAGAAPISHHDDRLRDRREDAAQAGLDAGGGAGFEGDPHGAHRQPWVSLTPDQRRRLAMAEPAASANDNGADGEVSCRSRLGGTLNRYHREAA